MAGYETDWRFQTLIGTVKGGFCGVPGRWPIRFQTLIGTVKGACPRPYTPRTLTAFQTLIGTVKGRAALDRLESWPDAFQTLIGTVKGKGGKMIVVTVPRQVSNPHRYGQRQPWASTASSQAPMFQTLIGTVKRRLKGRSRLLRGRRFKPS